MRAVAEAEKVRCEIGYTALTSLQRVRSTHCTLVAVLQLASALRFSLRGDRDFGRPWCCFIRVLRGREILFGGGCSSRRRDVISRLGITSPCRGECCLVLTHTRWTCPSSAASALSYSSLEWIAGGGSVWSIGGFFSHPSSYRFFCRKRLADASCCRLVLLSSFLADRFGFTSRFGSSLMRGHGEATGFFISFDEGVRCACLRHHPSLLRQRDARRLRVAPSSWRSFQV